MSDRPIRIPGPDHPITIERNSRRVVVSSGDTVIADTRRALTLREANYPPVQYIPRQDAATEWFIPSDHTTYCPYKGDASYWTIPGIDHGENATWSYEEPYDAVAEIRGHIAFYPDRVTIDERD